MPINNPPPATSGASNPALVDGSNADALHTHTLREDGQGVSSLLQVLQMGAQPGGYSPKLTIRPPEVESFPGNQYFVSAEVMAGHGWDRCSQFKVGGDDGGLTVTYRNAWRTVGIVGAYCPDGDFPGPSIVTWYIAESSVKLFEYGSMSNIGPDSLWFANGAMTFQQLSTTPVITAMNIAPGAILLDNVAPPTLTLYDSNNVAIAEVTNGLITTTYFTGES